ncbi:dihydromonapterin reductase [Shewanella salipaludis]|uniref:Dihydromonapterin reductase n=1 Tax=Shewanella salipaludis TaxID=2723052 RepID=A0A972FSN7_9GAMM|nr:dihydromonapterin reductase [Shewanella salipaludis]NMH65455.1 dihydromonapterin reductase [Shewanella salipaludis]
MKGIILITGVGKRIGHAMASHLLTQGYGVIGTYRRDYPSLVGLKAQGAELYPCDLADEPQLQRLLSHIKGRHPSLRGIIHNASDWLADDSGGSAAQTMAHMMLVHASAPYQINLALADNLKAAAADGIGAADIIHLTDYVAEKGSQKHIAYAASKAALHNMTLSFAAKLAPQVKVNSIAPALILFNEGDDAAYRQKAMAKAILPREAGEAEILNLVDYLLGSRYVTGRSFAVDGGRHLK